jgi:hypothetical protein
MVFRLPNIHNYHCEVSKKLNEKQEKKNHLTNQRPLFKYRRLLLISYIDIN